MAGQDESLEHRVDGPGARRAWLALGIALAAIVLIRLPLVLNARAHLDSDLAVDGLTLLEARQGHWRWHYPGTPHMGILPVLLSLPQSYVWGVGPETLASGGVVAYLFVVLATFALTWRVFGRAAALGSLVPLVFCSTGVLWLSGRITGGHLLSAAWHAAAFLGLGSLLARGGVVRAGLLGLWCGLGLYLDQMFLYTMLGLAPVAISAGFGPGRPMRRLAAGGFFAAAFVLGLVPQWLGERADPHDAYESQFQTILTRSPSSGRLDWPLAQQLAGEHLRILLQDCLPRLMAGYRLVPGSLSDAPWTIVGLLHEPSLQALSGGVNRPDSPHLSPGALGACLLGLLIFLGATVSLVAVKPTTEGATLVASGVRTGLFLSALATLGGFILNRHIYNSDNYRYLVFLVVPIAVGFGLLIDRRARTRAGLVAALVLAGAIAAVFSLDTILWYQRFGWLDDGGRPVRVEKDDPALRWLEQHGDVDAIFGGYWDVYRLSFLTGGRVAGVPYPDYPDRFPEVAKRFPGRRPRTLFARRDGRGPFYRQLSLKEGGSILHEDKNLWIIDWP